MDPMIFLTTEDEVVRMTMLGIADRHREITERHQTNLAVQIANSVGKMLGGKK